MHGAGRGGRALSFRDDGPAAPGTTGGRRRVTKLSAAKALVGGKVDKSVRRIPPSTSQISEKP
ncbi:hypothetical protein GCM10010129_66650 [Streptomyces fumigatiscleroticus]|nr:hypothetical protein GCM10010129_66650 [Streptomyces fumigatiscleroticus]